MPSRRAVLAGTAAVLTGGCVDSLGGCRTEYHVDTEPYDPAESVLADLDGPEAELARQTIRDDTTVVERIGSEPIRDGTYVVHEGAYYRMDLASEEVASIPALGVDLAWEDGRTPTDDDPVLAYADLPAADRAALRHAVYGDEYDGGGFPSGAFRFRDSRIPYPGDVGDSRLASVDHAWIDWDGRVVEITVHGPTEMDRSTYRYEATAVASDADEFRELIADERLVRLSGLTADEREILDAARRDSYEECDERSDALERLQRRLPDEGHGGYGSWYVEYDSDRFRLRIDLIENEF